MVQTIRCGRPTHHRFVTCHRPKRSLKSLIKLVGGRRSRWLPKGSRSAAHWTSSIASTSSRLKWEKLSWLSWKSMSAGIINPCPSTIILALTWTQPNPPKHHIFAYQAHMHGICVAGEDKRCITAEDFTSKRKRFREAYSLEMGTITDGRHFPISINRDWLIWGQGVLPKLDDFAVARIGKSVRIRKVIMNRSIITQSGSVMSWLHCKWAL